ncbi:hypothetical protein BGX24_007357, partial [Mortierella sp. AD032]
ATGQAPMFTKTMTAMTWKGSNGLLATYYRNSTTGVPFFNLFDPVTGLWTGLGLVLPPPVTNTTRPVIPDSKGDPGDAGKESSSLGGIIGGVVGALVVVAIIAFFFIRKRRNRSAAYSRGQTSDAAAGSNLAKKNGDKDEYNDENGAVKPALTRLATVQGLAKPYYADDDNRNAFSAGQQHQPQYISNFNNNMGYSPTTPSGDNYYQMTNNDPARTAGVYYPPITTTTALSPNNAFVYPSASSAAPAIPAYFQTHPGYVSSPPPTNITTTAAMVNNANYYPSPTED